jgi:hypothetical protein
MCPGNGSTRRFGKLKLNSVRAVTEPIFTFYFGRCQATTKGTFDGSGVLICTFRYRRKKWAFILSLDLASLLVRGSVFCYGYRIG